MSDVPTGVEARLDRLWRVSEVNSSGAGVNVGDVDMSFDLTGLGSVTVTDLRLLVDTDGDGVFNDETVGTGGVIDGATSLGSDIYQFAGVSAISDNLRFTIGTTNVSQTPLPIELISFTISYVGDMHVELAWKTAVEINNDYFTIERSIDAINWEEVERIDGAGDSNMVLSYFVTDNNPYQGVSYYRLKQTDFDRKFKYSETRRIDLQRLLPVVNIYPNPASDIVTIEGDISGLKEVQVYDLLGQNVSDKIILNETSDLRVVIDISGLNEGVYCLKTKSTTNLLYKK